MKRLVQFSLIFFSILFLFQSCKKENPEPTPEDTVDLITQMAVETFKEDTLLMTSDRMFFYDEDNNLIELQLNEGGFENAEFYNYEPDFIEVDYEENGNFSFRDIFNLNENGLVKDRIFREIQLQEEYDYDSEGRLIEIRKRNSDGNLIKTNEFIYSAGNPVTERRFSLIDENLFQIIEMTFSSGENTVGNENFGRSPFGKSNQNLPLTRIFKNVDSDGNETLLRTFSYTYEFDSENRVVKTTELNEPPAGPQIFKTETTYEYK